MEVQIISALLLALGMSAVADHPTHCSQDWFHVGTSCYAVYDSLNVTWQEAHGYCDVFGSDLVAIETGTKMQTIITLLNTRKPGVMDAGKYWIDANDILVEGKWRFQGREGDLLTYFNWAPGHPVTSRYIRCASLDMTVHAWVDQPCSEKRNFICEMHLADGAPFGK